MLKMFVQDNKMFRFYTAGLLLQGGQGQARGAETQKSQVAHLSSRRKARVAAPRLSAPRPTLTLSQMGFSGLILPARNFMLALESGLLGFGTHIGTHSRLPGQILLQSLVMVCSCK